MIISRFTLKPIISDNLSTFVFSYLKMCASYFSESSLQCTKPIYSLQHVEAHSTSLMTRLSEKNFSCFNSFSTSQFCFWHDSNNGNQIKQSVFKIGIIFFFFVLVWYQLTISVPVDSHILHCTFSPPSSWEKGGTTLLIRKHISKVSSSIT